LRAHVTVYVWIKEVTHKTCRQNVSVYIQGGPKKSKPPPIFQKIGLKIANEIRFLRKVKV